MQACETAGLTIGLLTGRSMGIFGAFKKSNKVDVSGFKYIPVLRDYDSFTEMVVNQSVGWVNFLYNLPMRILLFCGHAGRFE
jgi:hypothetical protein